MFHAFAGTSAREAAHHLPIDRASRMPVSSRVVAAMTSFAANSVCVPDEVARQHQRDLAMALAGVFNWLLQEKSVASSAAGLVRDAVAAVARFDHF
jgi:hypothetical protein